VLLDHGEIIRDQLALGPSLGSRAERVKHRSAQDFQLRERRIASSDSGMVPFWNARPSMKALVAMLSPISATGSPRREAGAGLRQAWIALAAPSI
jgi:hypothetical protein